MNLFGFLNGGADLTPEAAASRIAADSRSVIADVRTPGEFEERLTVLMKKLKQR